ncbi:AI-2E family transporter [Microbacterium radiodurans]|uniref:AI-2E family transporter n=1 Tax=Microbacterium radiodurans TaxID=661398 RepID=A0A5J5IT86_9MICO|nr:AI-2E family transporter [Microbacterium radiodurans]KAA9089314.1 AI-2E family transporter [Microbacterium radiodurans]
MMTPRPHANPDTGAAASPSSTRDRPTWGALSRPFAAGFFLTLGALTAILLGLALSSLSTVLIYVSIALFVALALDPVVRFLMRRGISRAWGIVITFVALAVIIAGMLWIVLPPVVKQIEQFVGDVPTIVNDALQSDTVLWLENTFGDSLSDVLNEVQSFVTNPANIAAIGGGLLQVGVSVVTAISGAIIVLVLSLYFLASLPRMKNALVRISPARSRSTVADMTRQITESIGGYLSGMVVLALMNAVFAFIVLTILGVPFAALLAVLAFAITLIPLVGTVLFWVGASVVTLLTNPTAPLQAIIFAVVYLVYMQVEAYLLTPRVMNRTVSVPGSLVVIGALVGGTLLGLLGALVAIPVTASILLIINQIVIPRQDAKKQRQA